MALVYGPRVVETRQRMSDLYIATTPLTALIAAGLARAEGPGAALVLIEDYDDAARWKRLFAGWRDTPFARFELVAGRATAARAEAAIAQRGLERRIARERAKRALREQAFARLREIDRAVLPARVFVGNDRRPETQFALHLAAGRRAKPGVYLDDGLFTYLGDAHERPIARRIDQFIKRRLYGSWWQGLPLVGTSRFIGEARLAYPALALDTDPGRRRFALARASFANRALARLARDAWRVFVPESPRFRCDALLLLPHTRLFRGGAAPQQRLRAVLARLGADRRVAVKYHPREVERDPLGLADSGARLLPHGLPAELALTRVARGGLVLGEASTALLAARWLREDLVVLDLAAADAPFARLSQGFLAARGVEPAAV